METSVGINNNTATDEFIYDLYAVCNHSGNLQGGHYTGKLRNSKFLHMLVGFNSCLREL